MSNPMLKPKISKITVNIGVGEGGERLAKAEALLEQLTGQKPVKTFSKSTNQTFSIRKGTPIACKVTLRKERADNFLKKALEGIEHRVRASNFDEQGNLSFGIKEHIDIPGVRYDPAVGIFGMDVCLTLERPGYRIKRRRLETRKVSKGHSLNKDDAIQFIKERYKVQVED
jgi:large subunit ribosomal protein L5